MAAIVEIAEALERVRGLSLNDRFNFATCPVKKNDPRHMKRLLTWAKQYSMGHPVTPFASGGGAAARAGEGERDEDDEDDDGEEEEDEVDDDEAEDGVAGAELHPEGARGEPPGADLLAGADGGEGAPMRGGNRLQRWEDEHSLCSLYVWLSFRFGADAFPHREAMQRRCEALVEQIVGSLEAARRQRRAAAERPAPARHRGRRRAAAV